VSLEQAVGQAPISMPHLDMWQALQDVDDLILPFVPTHALHAIGDGLR
jgi:hypothetical protein